MEHTKRDGHLTDVCPWCGYVTAVGDSFQEYVNLEVCNQCAENHYKDWLKNQETSADEVYNDPERTNIHDS